MSSRLRADDLPQPWFPSKKSVVATGSEPSGVTKCMSVNKNSSAQKVVEAPTKRGRGRPKSNSTVVRVADGKGKNNKSVRPSAIDVVFGSSKNAVPDIDELRQRREKDAAACGRRVRTIFQEEELKNNLQPTKMNSVNVQHPKQRASISFAANESPPISSGETGCIANNQMQPDKESPEVEMGSFDMEKETENDEQSHCLHRAGKEAMSFDFRDPMHASKEYRSSDQRDQLLMGVDHASLPVERISRGRAINQGRSASPSQEINNIRYKQRSPRRSESPPSWREPQQRLYSDSSRRISPLSNSRSSHNDNQRSPRRNSSKSPRHWRGDVPHRIFVDLPGSDVEEENTHQYDYENRNSRMFYNMDSRRHGREELFSAEREYQSRSSHSPHRFPRGQRRSSPPTYSRSPPRMPRNKSNDRSEKWTSIAAVEDRQLSGPSAVDSRKERRLKQSFQEEECERREKDGKKPFYLTLDGRGVPYGPGRPAWIAEINKLAKWLDPACTNIRKQTYEDVTTFKDRLNETFDYSGKLNQDELRGLMGKAVTRRRADLISLIKSGGGPLKTIDRTVWCNLEKLAWSKQRKDKSDQGRYANACRKTFGRTGSAGVNGLGERLRSLYGRSPDPDEVEEEMQRDKGFGGRKRKKPLILNRSHNNGDLELSSDVVRHSQSPKKFPRGSSIDGEEGAQYKGRAKSVSESQKLNRYDAEDVDSDEERRSSGYDTSTKARSEKYSKDDYIRRLKEEIQRLQANNTEAGPSKS